LLSASGRTRSDRIPTLARLAPNRHPVLNDNAMTGGIE
jgi:hypothetical protein